MKKILIALAVLVVLGGVAWFALQQRGVVPPPAAQTPPVDISGLAPSELSRVVSREVEGWKTYRNEKYGFEIKYPSSLVLNIPNSTGAQVFTIAKFDLKSHLFEEGERYSLFSIVPGSCKPLANPILKTIEVNGISMQRWDAPRNPLIDYVNADIRFRGDPKNGWSPDCNEIEMYADFGDSSYKELGQLFEAILSTFKFVPSTSFRTGEPTATQSPPKSSSSSTPASPPAVSYKTYTSTKFGFQFDYPSDWQITERGNRVSWLGSGFSIESSSSDQEQVVVQWFQNNHLSYDESAITIAGVPGKKFVGKWGMALKPYDLVTFNRGGAFYLVELPPTFSKIFLDTFKFIK